MESKYKIICPWKNTDRSTDGSATLCTAKQVRAVFNFFFNFSRLVPHHTTLRYSSDLLNIKQIGFSNFRLFLIASYDTIVEEMKYCFVRCFAIHSTFSITFLLYCVVPQLASPSGRNYHFKFSVVSLHFTNLANIQLYKLSY